MVIVGLTIFKLGQVQGAQEPIVKRSNFRDISAESSVIYRLNPVWFDYGEEKKIPGFNPEAVAQIDPKLVVFNRQREPLHVNYNTLEVFMIKELQKHEEEIKKLRQEIQQLKTRK